jgi:hypothetical protein
MMNGYLVLASLALFQFNLLLAFGIGLHSVTGADSGTGGTEGGGSGPARALIQWPVCALAVFASWLLFTSDFASAFGGGLALALAFPVSALLLFGLDRLAGLAVPSYGRGGGGLSPYSAYAGSAIAAVLFTLRLASTVAEAALLSACFPLGGLCASVLLRGIASRASREAVPRFLRGKPLLLLTMALLCLICSSLAYVMLYK